MDAAQAIEQSIKQDEIVKLQPETPAEYDALYSELLILCDDMVTVERCHDFWGNDGEEGEWRVLLYFARDPHNIFQE